MPLDQPSLLAAIALSSGALTLTLLVGWLGSRRDTYLVSWSIGLMLVVAGVIVFGLLGQPYNAPQHFASFALLLAGFAFIHAGAVQFRGRPLRKAAVAIMGLGLIALTAVPFWVGLAGLGTIFANLGLALLMALCALEYWTGRAESRLSMASNAVLYALSAVSFVLCAAVLVFEQRWVLTATPANWAESLNSIVLIVGLTGIGTVSLTLNQGRWARHHRQQAMTDELTGLLNRRALFEIMDSSRLKPGTGVIMFDIDHFKAINDQFGHAAGDVVLANFGRLINASLSGSDLAARLGGEEFCVVLRDTGKRSPAGIAEAIRVRFEQAGIEDLSGANTTLSAGVAIGGAGGEPFEAVLKRADEALYAAKAAGRNRVHAPVPRLVA